jgi:hypothetical protein
LYLSFSAELREVEPQEYGHWELAEEIEEESDVTVCSDHATE